MIKEKERKKSASPVLSAEEKKITPLDLSGLVINPELDRFSGPEFIPEKHKEDEIRLAKSILPPFK